MAVTGCSPRFHGLGTGDDIPADSRRDVVLGEGVLSGRNSKHKSAVREGRPWGVRDGLAAG